MSDRKLVVAYLGPPTSYTHQAALKTFDHQTHSFQPQVSIQDVFEAVQSSTATHGIVPFENSSNGSVIYTLDLFADRQHLFPSITVTDEAYLDIHHYLLGHTAPSSSAPPPTSLRPSETPAPDPTTTIADNASATPGPLSSSPSTTAQPRAAPLTRLTHITHLYSHPQAFGQCDLFLRTYLPHATRQEVSSTSAAATLVAQDETGCSAAISSLVAAGELGLGVLGKGIEDREDNCTRFFVLRRRDGGGSHASVNDSDDTIDHARNGEGQGQGTNGSHDENDGSDYGYKTLVSFTITHLLPGALADALMVFKTHGLNLTSINSRPSRVRPWHYIFFVEFEGRVGGGGAAVGGRKGKRTDVDTALDELQGTVEACRWLGSWRDRSGMGKGGKGRGS